MSFERSGSDPTVLYGKDIMLCERCQKKESEIEVESVEDKTVESLCMDCFLKWSKEVQG